MWCSGSKITVNMLINFSLCCIITNFYIHFLTTCLLSVAQVLYLIDHRPSLIWELMHLFLREYCQNYLQIRFFFHSKSEVHELRSLRWLISYFSYLVIERKQVDKNTQDVVIIMRYLQSIFKRPVSFDQKQQMKDFFSTAQGININPITKTIMFVKSNDMERNTEINK